MKPGSRGDSVNRRKGCQLRTKDGTSLQRTHDPTSSRAQGNDFGPNETRTGEIDPMGTRRSHLCPSHPMHPTIVPLPPCGLATPVCPGKPLGERVATRHPTGRRSPSSRRARNRRIGRSGPIGCTRAFGTRWVTGPRDPPRAHVYPYVILITSNDAVTPLCRPL